MPSGDCSTTYRASAPNGPLSSLIHSPLPKGCRLSLRASVAPPGTGLPLAAEACTPDVPGSGSRRRRSAAPGVGLQEERPVCLPRGTRRFLLPRVSMTPQGWRPGPDNPRAIADVSPAGSGGPGVARRPAELGRHRYSTQVAGKTHPGSQRSRRHASEAQTPLRKSPPTAPPAWNI